MDSKAILEASKDDLDQLGLKEKGHILCLKSFAMKNCNIIRGNSNDKNTLASMIKDAGSERVVKKSSNCSRLIQIGWKHASSNKSPYTQVRKQSGGGTREVRFQISDKLEEVKSEALRLFFPAGKSKRHGYLHNVDVSLGDFGCDPIKDLNKSISSHAKIIKMSGKMRIYLLTKPRSIKDLLLRDSEDDEDDFEPQHRKKGIF